MSSMLEQAIADAAALREQAIKNAEQSVLDKYSKQIKEAVDQMLEMEEPTDLDRANKTIKEAEDELMQEEDAAAGGDTTSDTPAVEAPVAAYDSRPEANDLMTRVYAIIDDIEADADGNVSLDLGDISTEEIAAADGDPEGDLGGLGDLGSPSLGGDDKSDVDSILGDLGGDSGDEKDDLDLQLQEVLEMLNEEDEEQIEEKMTYDHDPYKPTGTFGVMDATSKMNQEAAQAQEELGLEEEEESEEESEDSTNKLEETIYFLTQQNNKMESVLTKMETYLEETLLSNAILLYQNRTLSDASLNERQKSKIVEAIANAESPKEAKRLHETLKATVGSTPNSKKGPQSLSESVNRRSNLSSMLNTRQNINESKQSNDPFMEKMQKLAGIKK